MSALRFFLPLFALLLFFPVLWAPPALAQRAQCVDGPNCPTSTADEGYAWAQENNLTKETDCIGADEFQTGCRSFIQQQQQNAQMNDQAQQQKADSDRQFQEKQAADQKHFDDQKAADDQHFQEEQRRAAEFQEKQRQEQQRLDQQHQDQQRQDEQRQRDQQQQGN